jgi:hypothetical protein
MGRILNLIMVKTWDLNETTKTHIRNIKAETGIYRFPAWETGEFCC